MGHFWNFIRKNDTLVSLAINQVIPLLPIDDVFDEEDFDPGTIAQVFAHLSNAYCDWWYTRKHHNEFRKINEYILQVVTRKVRDQGEDIIQTDEPHDLATWDNKVETYVYAGLGTLASEQYIGNNIKKLKMQTAALDLLWEYLSAKESKVGLKLLSPLTAWTHGASDLSTKVDSKILYDTLRRIHPDPTTKVEVENELSDLMPEFMSKIKEYRQAQDQQEMVMRTFR